MKAPRNILITGASSGIGEGLARHYAAPGIGLALTGRNANRLADVAAACRAEGADVLAQPVDVTNFQTMEEFFGAAEKRWPLDLVFANAGIGPSTSCQSDPAAISRQIINVNVGGVLNTIHPARKVMAPRKRGQIAIMSSLAAYVPTPGVPAYGASKAAVKSLGLALRAEAAADSIGMTVICPGFVHSRITKALSRAPLIMPTDRAARLIAKRLKRDPAIITFPFLFSTLVRVIGALPDPVAAALMTRTSRQADRKVKAR